LNQVEDDLLILVDVLFHIGFLAAGSDDRILAAGGLLRNQDGPALQQLDELS
jgi:hypothetical protein